MVITKDMINRVSRELDKAVHVQLTSKFPYICKWTPWNNGCKIDGLEEYLKVKYLSKEERQIFVAVLMIYVRSYDDNDLVSLIVNNGIDVQELFHEICCDESLQSLFIEILDSFSYLIDDESISIDKTDMLFSILKAMVIYKCLMLSKDLDNSSDKLFSVPIKVKPGRNDFIDMLNFLHSRESNRNISNSVFVFIVGTICESGIDMISRIENSEEANKKCEDLYLDTLGQLFAGLNRNCLSSYRKKIIRLENKYGASRAEVAALKEQIKKETMKTSSVRRDDNNYKLRVQQLEDIVSSLNDKLEESYMQNSNLIFKVEYQDMLLSRYKDVDPSIYEDNEIEVEIAMDSIDIERYKICLICPDDYRNQFKYDTYDYHAAPKRIDLLYKYDLVVILTSCNSHKNTVGVVEFCKRSGVEFMYSSVLNNNRLVDEIKLYIKYKGI